MVINTCVHTYLTCWLYYQRIISKYKYLSAFPRNFSDSFNTSYHANCCPETWLCFFAQSLASDPRPLMATSVLKTDFLIPISADKKGCYFCFRVLANHSASFFFLYPVRRFIRTTISIQYILFFIHPVTECKHLLAFILTRICYFGCEELTYIPYSSFNSQSLAAC